MGCKCKAGTLIVRVTISPSGLVGASGSQVQFATDLPDPTGVTFIWHFGGGADPNTSNDVAPTVTLLHPDTYNISLTITDGDSFIVQPSGSYTVAGVPEVLSVSPDGIAGLPGETVAFSAEAEHFVTGWEWAFDVPGGPVMSTDAEPVLMLPDAGLYSGTVIAENSAGTGVRWGNCGAVCGRNQFESALMSL